MTESTTPDQQEIGKLKYGNFGIMTNQDGEKAGIAFYFVTSLEGDREDTLLAWVTPDEAVVLAHQLLDQVTSLIATPFTTDDPEDRPDRAGGEE